MTEIVSWWSKTTASSSGERPCLSNKSGDAPASSKWRAIPASPSAHATCSADRMSPGVVLLMSIPFSIISSILPKSLAATAAQRRAAAISPKSSSFCKIKFWSTSGYLLITKGANYLCYVRSIGMLHPGHGQFSSEAALHHLSLGADVPLTLGQHVGQFGECRLRCHIRP